MLQLSVRRLSLAGATLVITALPAVADWIPFGSVETGLQVVADSPSGTLLEWNLAGVERNDVLANGVLTQSYVIPGESALMEVGAPQLPVVRRSVALPDRGAFEVRVLEVETRTLSTAPVTPSKGHLTRDTNPADVPFVFGQAYQRAGLFPEAQAALLEPYIVRDLRGAIVEVSPFRYDPVSGQLEVVTRMELEVVPSNGIEINPFVGAHRPVDPEFAPIYDDLFLNYDQERYTQLPEPGRCLILTHETLLSAAQQLHEWKLQKGMRSMLMQVGDVGASSGAIKSYVQNLYNDSEGLTYVILVGDIQQIPTMYGDVEAAPSDVTYMRLAGTDYYPDAIISRISAQNLAQAENQINKIIRYEKSPDLSSPDSDWYHKGVGVASDEGGWSGYTDCERVQILRDMLLAYTYTQVDDICEPTATKQALFQALNSGRSILNYIGHGSGTSWGTTGFNNNDVHQLVNGYKNPFILDVSCSNGGFQNNECFAEAWMRTGSVETPRGAIAMYGSSLLCSWVPPTDMQNEAVRVIVDEERNSVGGSCMSGIMKALDMWPGTEGIALFEEYNIFGDGSLWLRTDAPAPLSVSHDGLLPSGAASYQVTVDEPNALVSIYANGTLYGSAYADGNGLADVVLDLQPPSPSTVTLTVSAYNHETHVEDLLVDNPSLAHVYIQSYSATDLGEGTTNGQIEAGEQVSISVTLTNDGLEDAHNVSATLVPTTANVTMVDAVAAFGEIAVSATADADAPFVFTVAPNAADQDGIGFTLAINATGGGWDEALTFTVHAPVLGITSVTVDDAISGNGDGVINPGETVDLVLNLANNGSGDAAGLNGHLVSRTLQIVILQGNSSLGALPAGGAGTLTPSFTVRANPVMPPNLVGFDLGLTGGNGLLSHLLFDLQMGTNPSDVNGGLLITQVELAKPAPNPAPGRSQIGFALPVRTTVDLGVYDASGRRVATLARGAMDAGIHGVNWTGRDDAGHELASGIYLIKLATDRGTQTERLTLLR
ncbi:MAG: T9SS type A sorting domain-containing protein [Candidatus Eisenbacteria bacterium]|nr:T9SS type A sorting domain-containing protein [Candidatus Eisenbacteria bacterium]